MRISDGKIDIARFAERSAVFRLYLQVAGLEGSSEVMSPVAIHDDMLSYALASRFGDFESAVIDYVEAGRTVASAIDAVIRWRFGSWKDVYLLDFASGWGRVTRHLLRLVSRNRITVGDVLASAVSFQEQVFGVSGILAGSTAAELTVSRKFNCVSAISLFTHLPDSGFREWLLKLWELVAAEGVLIFTAHDLSLYEGDSGGNQLVFAELSESPVLERGSYGTSWVTEDYVRSVCRALPGASLPLRLARGIGDRQDLYVIVKGEPLSPFHHDAGPRGFIDAAWSRLESVRISGWSCGTSPSYPVAAVEAITEDQSVQCVPQGQRPDVAEKLGSPWCVSSGWSFELSLPLGTSHSLAPLLIRAMSSSGAASLLHAGSLASLFLQVHRTGGTDDHDVRLKHEDEAYFALRERIRVLEEQMEAMKKSRFWKLREQWFRLKRFRRNN